MTYYVAAVDSSARDQVFADDRCTGVADDVKINAALAADLRVVLLPGTYTVAGNVLLNRSGHRLVSSEGGAVVRLATGAGVCPIVVGKNANPASSDVVADCRVKGIEIDGNFSTPVTGTATAGGASTLTDSTKSWTTNQYANYGVYVTGGTGVGQYRKVAGNTATQLTTTTAWATNPDTTSTYAISTQARLPSGTTFEGVNGLSGLMVCAGHRVRISDTYVHDTGGTGYDLQQSGQIILTDWRGEDCGLAPVKGPRNTVTVYGFSPNNAAYPDNWYTITNGHIRSLVDTGIDLHGNGDDRIVVGNLVIVGTTTKVPGPNPGTGQWGASIEMEPGDKQNNGRCALANLAISQVGHGVVVNVVSPPGTIPWRTSAVTLSGIQVYQVQGDGLQLDGDAIAASAVVVDGYGAVPYAVVSRPTAATTTTITDTTKSWAVNQWAGQYVTVLAGTGLGGTAPIASNTATVLTFANIGTAPDTASAYGISPSTAGSGVHLGAHGGLAGYTYTFRDINLSNIVCRAGGCSAPVLATPTTSTSGGTLPTASTYRYKVTALALNGGETDVSSEQTVTTGAGATNSIALAWSLVANGLGYKVYRTAAGGAINTELLLTTIANPNITTYTDTGALTPAGALPIANSSGALTQSGLTLLPSGTDVYDGVLIAGFQAEGPGKYFNQGGGNNAGLNVGGGAQVKNLQFDAIQCSRHNIGIQVVSTDGVQGTNWRAYLNNDHGIVLGSSTVLMDRPQLTNIRSFNNGKTNGGGGSAGLRARTTSGDFAELELYDDQGGSATQTWGLLFHTTSGSVSNRIRGGRAAGNVSGPVGVGSGSTAALTQAAAEIDKISDFVGVNPKGSITAPTVPASTVAQANDRNYDCMVLVTGGTVTNVALGGTVTGQTSGWFRVPARQTIAITYSVAPTWTWWAD